jgi:hypothetical protein
MEMFKANQLKSQQDLQFCSVLLRVSLQDVPKAAELFG